MWVLQTNVLYIQNFWVWDTLNVCDYLMSNKVLTHQNSGFKEYGIVMYQYIRLIENVNKCLEEENDVCLVLCDISKAFDKVYHTSLIFKMNS